MNKSIVFIDSEIGVDDKKIKDLGAIDDKQRELHTHSIEEFRNFIDHKEYLCGHNIIHHDLKYLTPALEELKGTFGRVSSFLKNMLPTGDAQPTTKPIDTLYLSPLLFPKRPYHKLLKDDKIQSDELNNPLNDAIKARDLFWDEVAAFNKLNHNLKSIYFGLLNKVPEFTGFFDFTDFHESPTDLAALIRQEFEGEICGNADLEKIITQQPVELAYTLALIGTMDRCSITPAWLLKNYPDIENVIYQLRQAPCNQCAYCRSRLNAENGLKKYFGYPKFRLFNNEPLQENAVKAAIDGKSLLAIFPTGGGKSITFQLPALIAGELVRGLTVVISPLQSLMKDQVDNLIEKGLTNAVTINGMLSPLDRKEAIEQVANGTANLLYISPEQLRSKTVESLLLKRTVVRFVIDEAHCFSAWGQDFRVDYLFIGDFIREYQEKKLSPKPVAVSCFTATAKQKVISDIKDYFLQKLGIELQMFTTSATRNNLHYNVRYKETDADKYNELRQLIEFKDCPTIVYASRTKRTKELAERLTKDGFPALPYNGKMDPTEKIANQEAFIRDEVKVMVATSAFGMGVDKPNVGLVVHYDISDSLENYVQEAGRAGRDQNLQADCYVLYNDNDLNKHFILLNQTKLSISEIQQVWKTIRKFTKDRLVVKCSALDIAREIWGESDSGNETRIDKETRVKTAIAALEDAGFVKRGRNYPRIFADSIRAKNMDEAGLVIDKSENFESPDHKLYARRIIKSLISSRSIANANNGEAESRIDYLADTLGIKKRDVISCINTMRQDGLLADGKDMSAFISYDDTENKAKLGLERFVKIENFLLGLIGNEEQTFQLKELNGLVEQNGIKCTVRNIRTIFYYLTIKGYIKKEELVADQSTRIVPILPYDIITEKFQRRIDICRFVVKELYKKVLSTKKEQGMSAVEFSILELLNGYNRMSGTGLFSQHAKIEDVEDALLYLQKIGVMKLEGGFLVFYNNLEIQRFTIDKEGNKILFYNKKHYEKLEKYYELKTQQIHIVGEYANLMVKDYNAALAFVADYFTIDYKKFINKYFKGERIAEIKRSITPDKYQQIFGELSAMQKAIIDDNESKNIVVAAGPGSGKTRVLVHKLASLLLLEDVKHEQLLMLTFSRAAATEFKKRLINLVGNAAAYVDIKTFHSYCFDLLGKIGSIEDSKDVVRQAVSMIENGEVDPKNIAKTVLVIDEAQDMDADEFALVEALMKNNENMRVIAVGDDDQNIYDFRGASSQYMKKLIDVYGAKRYELVENYRSKRNVVALANAFSAKIGNRMKSQEVTAIQKELGKVIITKHTSPNLEEPILRMIQAFYKSGSACVLTATNNEAANMVGLLTKKGYRAKLIQSLNGFRLSNLMELRHFTKIIHNNLHGSPIIDDKLWNEAKTKLNEIYATSTCLEICNKLIADFEAVNNKAKYWSNLQDFITESNLEDFYQAESGTIIVSTIHKSKGREFDNVYLMLNNHKAETDEEKRALYVAMTRAKENLFIHCNNSIFDAYHLEGVEHRTDATKYAAPAEIALQLSHKDVFLSFFKDKKEAIFKLRSGMSLKVYNENLVADINGRETTVGKLSKKCQETVDNYKKMGYETTSATIDFIVAWKGEEDKEESAIILPTLKFRREIN